ncbi:hypothetical protein Tco_0799792 [Tanacetum coccineum]|uniref:Retrotransposon protein, putative, Ty1-copia subclass n=1 Tax=Tanacetum coccineum TaxID=301880 RepID=A0ABQ4ZRB8_9ASTR
MENSKRGSIPMQEKFRLSKSEGASTPTELKRMQNVPYASAVGSIMYAVRCTRSDVAFAQNITSRFQQNPGDLHWTTVKNILKYLKNTKNMFLLYKVEYIAAYDASKEAVWVRKFTYWFGVVPTIEEPISMYYDNPGAITIANESGITKGARHFRAKVQYLREVFEFGDIKLEKVYTYDNLADPFTKALAFPKHSEHTRNIGMLPANSLIMGVLLHKANLMVNLIVKLQQYVNNGLTSSPPFNIDILSVDVGVAIVDAMIGVDGRDTHRVGVAVEILCLDVGVAVVG